LNARADGTCGTAFAVKTTSVALPDTRPTDPNLHPTFKTSTATRPDDPSGVSTFFNPWRREPDSTRALQISMPARIPDLIGDRVGNHIHHLVKKKIVSPNGDDKKSRHHVRAPKNSVTTGGLKNAGRPARPGLRRKYLILNYFRPTTSNDPGRALSACQTETRQNA
jgi:hypothetical protein